MDNPQTSSPSKRRPPTKTRRSKEGPQQGMPAAGAGTPRPPNPPPTTAARYGRPGRRPPRRRKGPVIRPRLLAVMLVPILVVVVGVIVTGSAHAKSSPATTAPEGIRVPQAAALAAVSTAHYGQPIDGIACQTSEQVVYHIHAELAIFVNGVQQQVPGGIGIAPPQQTSGTSDNRFVDGGSCFYFLHTHASDGIIHVESPKPVVYTLGQFFDIWGQPLSANQVGPATGHVTAFVNGKAYPGDPAGIQLEPHDVIQLDVGTPVAPPVTVSFAGTGL